jgi:hypothetical protein
MGFFLKVGAVAGGCLGLLHAGYVYRQMVGAIPTELASRPMARHLRGVYYAVWTVGLWTVFGFYVFYLWALGVVVYALTRAVQMLHPVR